MPWYSQMDAISPTRSRPAAALALVKSLSCELKRQKPSLLRAVKDKLGIEVGGTTADRQFSLEVGRCFGACGMAPVLMVNDDLHQRVKPAKLGELLQKYRETETPAEEVKP